MNNIQKLILGKTYTYKELCQLLDMPYRSGNTKLAQLKRLRTYVNFEKVKTKFVILEIYETKLEYFDGRKSVNAKTKGKFITPMTIAILKACLEYDGIFIVSKSKLISMTKLVNKNFEIARNNIELASKIIGVNSETLKDFITETHAQGNKVVERTLNNLRNRGILISTEGLIVAETDGTHRLATTREKNIIAQAEKFALDKLNCKTKNGVMFINKWVNFRRIVKIFLEQNDMDHIKYYYNGYEIVCPVENIAKTLEEEEEGLQALKLTEMFSNTLNNIAKNKHEKDMRTIAIGEGMKHSQQLNYLDYFKKCIEIFITTEPDIDLEEKIRV